MADIKVDVHVGGIQTEARVGTKTLFTPQPGVGTVFARIPPNGSTGDVSGNPFRTGDTVYHMQNGSYDYTPPSNPLQTAALANGSDPWFTLQQNNTHGNLNTFTDELGTQAYLNNLIVDHYRGYMIYRIPQAAVNWNTMIDDIFTSNQGGFSNWRPFLPAEQYAYFRQDKAHAPRAWNYAPFNIGSNALLATGTTDFNDDTMLVTVSSNGSTIASAQNKTSSQVYLMIRTHLT